jgi:hypothetical protein
MLLFKTNEEVRKEFSRFLDGLRGLGSKQDLNPFWAEPGYWEFRNVGLSFEDTNIPIRWVRDLFYSSSKKIDVGLIEPIGLGGDYVRRCLGHRVNLRGFLANPRLCVLVARRIVGGRWREAEECISSDSLASYLYSKHVVNGILPSEMHSRMVLRTFSGLDFASRAYFEGFTTRKN